MFTRTQHNGCYSLCLLVGSAIVDMYLNFGKLGYAYKVFDGIPEPDTVLCKLGISLDFIGMFMFLRLLYHYMQNVGICRQQDVCLSRSNARI